MQSKPQKYKKRTKARVIRSVFYNKEANPEKHYRELIMLFTPWRSEEIDLLGNFASYQDNISLLRISFKNNSVNMHFVVKILMKFKIS